MRRFRWPVVSAGVILPRSGESSVGIDSRFRPAGIRWVVERTFAWLGRYRRLDTVFDRAGDLVQAHVWIESLSEMQRS